MKKVLMLALILCVVPVLSCDSETVPAFFQSEAFAQLLISVAALALYLVRQKVNEKTRRAIDMCIGIANGVEKGIPDNTDRLGMKKIDKALKRFARDWKKLNRGTPAEWLIAIARGAFERWVADRNSGRPL